MTNTGSSKTLHNEFAENSFELFLQTYFNGLPIRNLHCLQQSARYNKVQKVDITELKLWAKLMTLSDKSVFQCIKGFKLAACDVIDSSPTCTIFDDLDEASTTAPSLHGSGKSFINCLAAHFKVSPVSSYC